MKKDLIILLFIWVIVSALIILSFSCNPLHNYNKVYADSVGRCQDKRAILAHVCSAEFPIKVKDGQTIYDTQYVANPFQSGQCDSIIDALNRAVAENKNIGHINIDSLRAELLGHIKGQVITRYKTDTILDVAQLTAAAADRDKAILNAANVQTKLCKAETTIEQFNEQKADTWTVFKWFVKSLPWWVWVLLTLVVSGSVIRFLRIRLI